MKNKFIIGIIAIFLIYQLAIIGMMYNENYNLPKFSVNKNYNMVYHHSFKSINTNYLNHMHNNPQRNIMRINNYRGYSNNYRSMM